MDPYWSMTFLPEEINANAFIRPQKGSQKLYVSEENINNYLKKYKNSRKLFNIEFFKGKNIIKFYTKGFIFDGNSCFELGGKGYNKGLRLVNNINKEIDDLIRKSTEFLASMLGNNGKYQYGFFPHFDKEISFYNILRHSSSTYALIEGLSYLNRDISITRKAIDYIIDNYLCEDSEGVKFVFDDTNGLNEIKLGQNASLVFAICEFLKTDNSKNEYLKVAQEVAKGIIKMIDLKKGETVHVLNYPDFSIKERKRVVYYDGEAALSLLRLYQLDHNIEWLCAVKQMFEYFIDNKYWKYHDHWLGYCTNELVKIEPKEKYYRFGIQNVSSYLDYIKMRETTYPTFLEMLMATYHTIENAKCKGYQYLIDELINEELFIETIHTRANYERTGFFYPEVAMYFKNPGRILNSFFIKHHGYRVRIDDIEHYISGYVQYQKVFNCK